MWKAAVMVFDVLRKTMVPSVSITVIRVEIWTQDLPNTYQDSSHSVCWLMPIPFPTPRHLKVMHEHYVRPDIVPSVTNSCACSAVCICTCCVAAPLCLSPLSLSRIGFYLHTLMCALKWDWPAFQRWTISGLLQRAIEVLLTGENTQLGSFISCGNKGTGVSFVCSLMYSPFFTFSLLSQRI